MVELMTVGLAELVNARAMLAPRWPLKQQSLHRHRVVFDHAEVLCTFECLCIKLRVRGQIVVSSLDDLRIRNMADANALRL